MEDDSKTKLKQWLESLQQESWQLELLISGFAIFLILGTFDSIQQFSAQVQILAIDSNTYQILFLLYFILIVAWYILMFNLIFHVLLRGLWISAIGLRYVSGDIDYEVLRFKKPFNQFLPKRIKSFDNYIERLEKICSVIFSFTFLVIFTLISMGSLIGFALVLDFIQQRIIPHSWVFFTDSLGFVLVLIFTFSSFLYFIDFITLGGLKRIRWLAPIYFPLYRFFSWITLSALYRPIYYNLIDNRFGRWLGLLLVPYAFMVVNIINLKVNTHGYMAERSRYLMLNNYSYEDLSNEEQLDINARIPSKYVQNGFLELFIPYTPIQDDPVIQMQCPDLLPVKETGLGSELKYSFSFGKKTKKAATSPADSVLLCWNQFYEVYIDDSLFQAPKWRFYKHPKGLERGLITILDVQYLDRGEHTVRAKRQYLRRRMQGDTLVKRESVFIPFWKE